MNLKMLAALPIVAGVIVIPLVLKSNRSQSSVASAGKANAQTATSTAPVPAKSLPRFVDLGTTTCAPCKVMLGVMADLARRYPDAMRIDFVNVQTNPEEAQRYGIEIIPSQIFYSPDGREIFRHTGVYRAEEIIAKWAEFGFPMTAVAQR